VSAPLLSTRSFGLANVSQHRHSQYRQGRHPVNVGRLLIVQMTGKETIVPKECLHEQLGYYSPCCALTRLPIAVD
jgi:hypothetical protein